MRKAFCVYESFEFIPIVRQVEKFLADLDPRQRAKVYAACEHFATSLAINPGEAVRRSPRTELIRGSKVRGLFELRGTWPKAPGPQLRLICVREGKRILLARGVVKRTQKLPRSEIELAERTVKRHRSGGDERRRKGR